MMQEDIYRQLEASGLGQYWPALQPHLRPSVKISTAAVTEDLTIGISRFGGKPDLLPETEWPHTRFEIPLRFLGQFNLAETAPLGTAGILPEQGLLSFFYHNPAYFGDGEEDDEEFHHTPGVVFYFPDTTELERINSPVPTFPETSLQCYSAQTVPSENLKLSQEIFGEDNDRYRQLPMNDFDWDHHQLLGYASSPDEEFMGADLELEINKLTNLTRPMGTTSEMLCVEHGIEAGIQDWQLLLKLEYDKNLDWNWGKGGTLFFMIRKQDLASHDFSRVETYNWFV